MNFAHLRDGELVDISVYKEFLEKGLLTPQDVVFLKNESKVKINCVGFAFNPREDALAIFPKHFKLGSDPSLGTFYPVFKSIQLADSASRSSGWGRDSSSGHSADIETNYPFGAFFNILSYYNQFGLYLTDIRVEMPNRGKVNWKKTISKTSYFLVNERLSIFPLWREDHIKVSNFVTEAMIFAINHTIELFGSLLKIPPIPYQSSFQVKSEGYAAIVHSLRRIRSEVFNDRVLLLLDSLIEFFSYLNTGAGLYFKCGNFSFVWQKAVEVFLRDRFVGIGAEGAPIFDETDPNGSTFGDLNVKGFNSSTTDQSVCIDHYWFDSDQQIQYIFDAKYYDEVRELNYKQVFYTLLLSIDPKRQGTSIISALVLPAEEAYFKTHFVLDDTFAAQLPIPNSRLKISEFYLDCNAVLDHFYLSLSS